MRKNKKEKRYYEEGEGSLETADENKEKIKRKRGCKRRKTKT